WGAGAGASGVAGALALYLGFRYAAFSVASSISAGGTATFSVLAGLALGERPGSLSPIGICLPPPAIVGVSACTRPAGTGPRPPRHAGGVGLGLAAGAGFGLFVIGLDRAGSGTDLWPIVISQVTATVTVACVAPLPAISACHRPGPGGSAC